MWQDEGIKYTESADEAEKYKLGLPVHNMNDLLFAHLLEASNFGNGKIDSNGSYGTMLIYAGHRQKKIHRLKIPVNGSNFLDGMAKLKEQAIVRQGIGHRYMRVATESPEDSHAENIDIDALLAFDPNNMETGKTYAIGDRNYWDYDMSQNIPHLAVRRTNGIAFEFGELCGSRFKKDDTLKFHVYTTDVEKHDAEYWEQFKP
ncbi:MAG: hypothetical protein LBK24_00240 [Puniceicoccales bacterium]|jgi:hypothetical protein|nr:hypothetical protein [Puniceicoccales bacterium]